MNLEFEGKSALTGPTPLTLCLHTLCCFLIIFKCLELGNHIVDFSTCIQFLLKIAGQAIYVPIALTYILNIDN